MPNNIAAHFSSLSDVMNASRGPSSPMALTKTGSWSWQQFQSDTAAVVAQLESVQQQNIALCSHDTYLFAVGFFALCHANKTIVLPGNYQPNALIELSAQYDWLLCDATIASSINNADGEHTIKVKLLFSGSIDNSKRLERTPAFPVLDLESQSMVLYTSGSSGKPKSIKKTLSQLDTEIRVLEEQWGDQLLGVIVQSTVSHQHIYGLLFKLLWPLCAGRPFNNETLEFPEQILTHSDKNTLLVSSPALLKRLTQQTESDCRMVFSSGGPLSFNAAQMSEQALGKLPTEVFGSTETGGIAFRQQTDDNSPWQLFPTLNAEVNPEGCLRLKSPYIDASRWYQTADQIELLGDGFFDLKGRADRVVKIEEKRISLVEVEKRLEQLPWIEESAVIPMYDNERLTLVSAIVLNHLGERKIDELGKGKFWILLRAELRQWLEPIATPKRFRVVSEIPLSSQGKRLTANIEQLFEI